MSYDEHRATRTPILPTCNRVTRTAYILVAAALQLDPTAALITGRHSRFARYAVQTHTHTTSGGQNKMHKWRCKKRAKTNERNRSVFTQKSPI